MKGALIGLFAGVVLLVAPFLTLPIYRGASSINIHLHDTYFVIDYLSATVFVLLVLGTFFSIGGIISTRFRRRVFAALLILFLAIDAFYIVAFYKALQNTSDLSFPMNGPLNGSLSVVLLVSWKE